MKKYPPIQETLLFSAFVVVWMIAVYLFEKSQ